MVGYERGGWLSDNVRREVGDGLTILFWNLIIFRMLYDSSQNKLASIANMNTVGWGGEWGSMEVT